MKIFDHYDQELLQQDLQRLEDWENTWQMSFNPSKCNTIQISSIKRKNALLTTYHLHGQQLVVASPSKYLGVTITDNLFWTNHAEPPEELQTLHHQGQVRHLRHYGTPLHCIRVCSNCLEPLQSERRPGA